eukprot:CAMPEP_0194333394 /NCGR_PEP_ID=MMETSP0171-20130528/62622_1 /TAXON_ID=218684 /ORGANISM="Corethron pennatum, Strain L29A3" /LENGTH=82 /DNA_ID=CAMNT_0039095613 /DNA_START=445 /DNA_END=691 /DNA_ORIENTATION=+
MRVMASIELEASRMKTAESGVAAPLSRGGVPHVTRWKFGPSVGTPGTFSLLDTDAVALWAEALRGIFLWHQRGGEGVGRAKW